MDGKINNSSDLETSGLSRYHVDIDMNSNGTHATVIRLVGNAKKVLELGCASGHVSRVLRNNRCEVVGVEIDAGAAEHAKEYCERVIVGDLDRMNFAQELGEDRFDIIIAADVLEHLKDPLGVLEALKPYLKPEGSLVASIPNVAHLSVRLALLSGRFPYSETGLLDRTHIRFFTRESVERLFDNAGFAIGHLQRMEKLPSDPQEFDVPYSVDAVPAPVLETLLADAEARTYQFVLVAYPLPRSGLVLMQNRMRELAHEAERWRSEASGLEAKLEQITERNEFQRTEIEASNQRMAELQSSLEGVAAESRALVQDLEQLRQRNAEAEHAAQVSRDENAQRDKQIRDELAEFQEAARTARIEAATACQSLEEHKKLLNALESRLVVALEDNRTLSEDMARLMKESIENAARGESQSYEAAQSQAEELRRQIDERDARNAKLKAQVEALHAREKDLREMLLEAHDQLLRRDEDIAAALATAGSPGPQLAVSRPQPAPAPSKFLAYQQLVSRIRELAAKAIPGGKQVLVISKGDDSLLSLGGSRGLHFPQRADGVYAGYYPATDSDAIAHLKALHRGGAQFLIIPQTALWWLDHYSGFANYLRQHCVRVIDQPESCIIYDLGFVPEGEMTEADRLLDAQPRNGVSPAIAPVLSAESQSALAASGPEAIGAAEVSPAGGLKAIGLLTQRPFGVNISGHLRSEKGVGEGVRSTVRSLKAAGLPVSLADFTDNTSANIDSEFTEFSEERPYSINLLHANADWLVDVLRSERGQFTGHYNIGFWAWEVTRFPDKWLSSFRVLDEVWVPSSFVQSSVSRVSPVPVLAIPHSLPQLVIPRGINRKYFDLPNDHFVFLFMFDFMSVMERKNPFGLIEAFKKAFKRRDKATLVLKTSHAERCPADRKALAQAAERANIKIIDGVLGRGEINGLLNACNSYVSLHRAEGFGLTIAEAMSLAKPVIATAFSGNMDYMTAANSFPVNYTISILEQDYPPYEAGSKWAQPDLNHAAELMRRVYEAKGIARETGRRAQKDIHEQLSPAAVGKSIRERFAKLAATGKIAVPAEYQESAEAIRPKAREPEPAYRRLIIQTRKMVLASTPKGATVMVISRGDDDLLKLEGRRAWHFPQQEDGQYAGYNPSDSAAAIGHLEVLRAKGAEFLLIPRTALWWLEHYVDFRRHLDSTYRKIKGERSGVLYQLARPAAGMAARMMPVSRDSERIGRKVNGAAHPSLRADIR